MSTQNKCPHDSISEKENLGVVGRCLRVRNHQITSPLYKDCVNMMDLKSRPIRRSTRLANEIQISYESFKCENGLKESEYDLKSCQDLEIYSYEKDKQQTKSVSSNLKKELPKASEIRRPKQKNHANLKVKDIIEVMNNSDESDVDENSSDSDYTPGNSFDKSFEHKTKQLFQTPSKYYSTRSSIAHTYEEVPKNNVNFETSQSGTGLTPHIKKMTVCNRSKGRQNVPKCDLKSSFQETETICTSKEQTLRDTSTTQYDKEASDSDKSEISHLNTGTPRRQKVLKSSTDSEKLKLGTIPKVEITRIQLNEWRVAKTSEYKILLIKKQVVQNPLEMDSLIVKSAGNNAAVSKVHDKNIEDDDIEVPYYEERSGKRKISVSSSDSSNSIVLNTKRKSRVVTIYETPTRRNTEKTPRKRRTSELDDTTSVKRLTPKSLSKSLRRMTLTPSVQERTVQLGKPMTPLQQARRRLHVSAVPKSLPCREEEFNEIYRFLHKSLADKIGGCIYISGVPGTGKTATVNEAVKCLRRVVTKGELDDFKFAEINGMKLTEPRQAYVQVVKQLTDKVVPWEQAQHLLENMFMSRKGKTTTMTLLLVDELDLLCTKRQDVVYNFLDWPARSKDKLIVITIANTMDLPEKVLLNRVNSRLGLTRLTFQPYNYKQLQEIVLTRLQDIDLFKDEAVQLVSRKVAAVSGDARRALDICRRVTEIAEKRGGDVVSMEDVHQALAEMIATPKVQAIKHCSRMERLFLQAVSAVVSRTGVEETIFKKVHEQFETQCMMEGLKVPNVTQLIGICGRLGASRLILCEHSKADIYQKILLNVSPDDIHFAIQKSITE